MKRILIHAGLLAVLGLHATAADRKPNVLLIVADDLGYGELGFQGFNKDIPTPNIDSIAANGTRFTNGYVSGTYCSPTRAGLLTGRYQQRFGHEFNPGQPVVANEPIGLALTETTIGDRFRKAGYATGWFGKSHLGNTPEYHPLSRGFDEFYGFLGGAHSYVNPRAESDNPILRGREIVKNPGYLTEAFAKEAVDFIERKKDAPWFVYLPFNAVHAPLEATEKYESRFTATIADEKRRKFAGLLSALDDGVGSVLAKIRELNLEEDTLVIFISDNGGPTQQTTSNNGPLRGFKGQTWEGGIHIPFAIQWKGKIPAAKVDTRPVIQLDLLPTSLAAAGVEVEKDWKIDGVNLLPYIKDGKTEAPHDALFWRFGPQLAIRKGDWKLVKGAGVDGDRGDPTKPATTAGAQLYNLAEDIGETTDLAAKNPDKVKELAAQWDAWNSELVAPKWYPGRAAAAGVKRQEAPVEPAAAEVRSGAALKSGDSLGSPKSPQIANHGFTISAQVDAAEPSGVILSQGGPVNGYALHLKDGALALSVRVAKALTVVVSLEKLAAGSHQVEADVASDGAVILKVDGKPSGEGKLAGLIGKQPGEGLHVGDDGDSAVGDYAAPAAFSGTVANAVVTLK